jgi:hypothetical protein
VVEHCGGDIGINASRVEEILTTMTLIDPDNPSEAEMAAVQNKGKTST